MEIKGDTILWVKDNKNWIVSPKTLINAYIKGSPEPDLLKTIGKIAGRWWLSTLKEIKMYKKVPLSKLKNLNVKLGTGQYATVYAYNKYAVKVIKCTNKVNGVTESKILRLLDLQVTRNLYTPNIIQMYQYTRDKNIDYIILQKLDTSLWRHIQSSCSLQEIKGVILQVIFTLLILQKLYPGFRHNDLKIDNILLDLRKRENLTLCYGKKYWLLSGTIPLVKIADFDYSNIPKHAVNPKVGTAFTTTFGCTKRSSKIYDVHLFFNSLWRYRKNVRGLEAYIRSIIPKAVLGVENEHLLYSRLRHPDKWVSKIMTPLEILKRDYKTVKHSNPSWGLKG